MKFLKLSAIGIVCLLFFACAGIQDKENVGILDLTSSTQNKSTVRVLAKAANWKSSGVLLKKGEKYKIKATGRWRVGGL